MRNEKMGYQENAKCGGGGQMKRVIEDAERNKEEREREYDQLYNYM